MIQDIGEGVFSNAFSLEPAYEGAPLYIYRGNDILVKGDEHAPELPTYGELTPACHHLFYMEGKGCYINVNCNFIDDGKITIGDAVMFGPAVSIATVGHPIRPDMRTYMYCDHVTIGNNCVIGAGSVVTKDIPSGVVAVGNPCKPIRDITDDDMQFYFKDRRFDEEAWADIRKKLNRK